MALIKCPECGKEISDKALACPNCGCPASEFFEEEKTEINDTPKELPPEECPDMMECHGCGRKIPTDISVCPFCNYNYGLQKENNLNNIRKKRKNKPGCGTVIFIIFALIVILAIIGIKYGGNENSETESLEKGTETLEKNSEKLKETEIKETANFEKELNIFSSGEYLFITNDDLNKYSANMEGTKVYVVTKIDDMKDENIQSTLTDGFMMSNFHVENNFERYQEILKEDDLVAILGTVSGYNSYSFMGKSVELDDCLVFAVGDDAEKYRKDNSDEGLAQYFFVTEDVANSNSDISEEEYKGLCETLNYEDVLRNPDSNDGKYCVVSGTVNQIIEGFFGGYTIYIMDSNGNKWECSYSYKDDESHLLEGDK